MSQNFYEIIEYNKGENMKTVMTNEQYTQIIRKIKNFCSENSDEWCRDVGGCPIRKNCIYNKYKKYNDWEFAQEMCNKIQRYEIKREALKQLNPFIKIEEEK